MKRIFQHRYIVRLLALGAFSLLFISITAPFIKDYNYSVLKKQIELRREANGASDTKPEIIDFSGYSFRYTPEYFAEKVFLLIILFSLMLTQKIAISILLGFLFIFQFLIVIEIFYKNVQFPMSYFFNDPSFAFIFIAFALALSISEVLLLNHYFPQRFQGKRILK